MPISVKKVLGSMLMFHRSTGITPNGPSVALRLPLAAWWDHSEIDPSHYPLTQPIPTDHRIDQSHDAPAAIWCVLPHVAASTKAASGVKIESAPAVLCGCSARHHAKTRRDAPAFPGADEQPLEEEAERGGGVCRPGRHRRVDVLRGGGSASRRAR